ncbi:MAG: type II secretion system protein [Phycisphaerales bacterium]|jgi:type II secretory pathway pseudopilin PulG|nr:type II secretion system protein [Phycisphaerales bacterium]
MRLTPAIPTTSRRGFTLLEAVLAALMVGLAASLLAGAGTLAARVQARERQRLAAAELCNRLVLQYLDSRDALPPGAAPIDYGPDRFRWALSDKAIRFEPHPSLARNADARGGLRVDSYRQITMRVWLAEDSGGDRYPSDATPQYAISRLIDSLAFRNYDSFAKMVEGGNIGQIMNVLEGGQAEERSAGSSIDAGSDAGSSRAPRGGSR